MKEKWFLKLLCLTLMLGLLLAFAVTANAAGEGPSEPASLQEDSAPALNVAYKNLSYSSNIYVMYAVSYKNVSAPEDIQMLFWDAPQRNGYLYGTQKYAVSESRREKIGDTYHRVFYSDGVAPKELVDNQYCCAYVRIDGVDYYSEVIKFSPLSYIKTLSEKPTVTEADFNLVNALRAYGNAAQIRFNYKLEDLASEPHYDITLQNAVLDDGFPYGLYKEGTELTLTAVVPEGDSLARWVDSNGTELGTAETLNYTLTTDVTVRAIMASDPDSCEHVYGSWIAAADPTCTEDGTVGHYHCELCGRNFDADHAVIAGPVAIPRLGHDWVNVEAQAPTCVPGHTAYHYCARCGEKEGYTELEATDPHSYVENVVEPAGERRGYTDHVCAVCGDSYRTDYDYSLYSGVNFADAGKFPISNYNFDSSVYTIEVSLNLPTTQTTRAGVLLGNYDGTQTGFNFEIYSNGKPRLYFYANPVGANTKKAYNYYFDTDVRGTDVKNLALVIDAPAHSAKLYVDGVFVEEQTLADFVMPSIGRTMVLGGDNRTGNSQSFKGTIYSATIYRDVRTEEELVNDLVIADASDQNCIVSYNLIDSDGLTGAISLDDVLESAQVTTVADLAYHASHGTKNIEVMNDIIIDRTIFVISDVTIFSNSDCTLLRDPNFYSDIFVIGENDVGRNLILDNISCILNLGKAGATGTLTVDGNKENVTGGVYGSLVYINNSGKLNLHDGAVLTNNKKVGNARSLGMEQYYANMAGGAAILNINGVASMDGGVISNNEVNFTDLDADPESEAHLQSCYGGAVFNNSNFSMTGGSITGNSGYYGGAVANFQECNLTAGLVENNFSSHAGGAVYMLNNYMRTLTVGSEDAPADSIIFRGNYNEGSSGGAIYSGASGSVLLLGGAHFEGNHVPGNGGAIYVGSLSRMEGVNTFTGNYAGSKGGAIYLTAPAEDRRTIEITNASFSENHADQGGAIGIVGADATITDCAFSSNHTNRAEGGAIFVNRLTDGDIGADVTISGGSFSGNTANTEGGAIFGDLNCAISVSGASFTDNSSTTAGGAVCVHGVEKLRLTNVTASGNSAGTNGGALYLSYRTLTDNTDPENPVYTKFDSSATVTGCTLTGSTATGFGGAIAVMSGNSGAEILTMSGTTVSGSTAANHGGALYVNSGAAKLNNNTFTDNTSAQNGGAVYGTGATVTGAGNSFTGNSSTNTSYGGGAMYFTHSSAALSGSTFTGNSANVNGGAIAAYSESSVTLTDTTAAGNTAGSSGGFAMTYDSTLTMNTTGSNRNTLGDLSDDAKGNTANSGGAIYADYSSTVSISNADIGYNSSVGSGGALYFTGATGTLSGCTVSHNVSGREGGDSFGGAMMVGYASDVTVSNSSFSDNTATQWGGAIYVRHKNATDTAPIVPSTLTLTGTGFTGNSAGLGGAIYANTSCVVDATDCSFTENRSTTGAGGAIYANGAAITLSGTTLGQNSAGTTGGAIYLYTGSTLSATDDCLFDQNTSAGIGGALYCNSANATLTDTDFTNNATTGTEAWYGGAIYTNGTSQLRVTGCEFTGNSNPTGTGGAICARGNGVLEINGSSFAGNTAKTLGGAVHVFGTVTASITDSDFTGNSVTHTSTSNNDGAYAVCGGAVMVGNGAGDGSFLTLTGGVFSGNNAPAGGAIGVRAGTRLDVSGTTFSGNTSGANGGGAIFAEAGATVNITDATIGTNSTTGSGGAIYAKENVAATITNTEFTSNSAGYGGAMIVYGANVTLNGGSFNGNSATGSSGAIYLRQGGSGEPGTVTANGTAFTGNMSPSGAAIYVNTNAALTTTDVTFSENGSAADTNDGGAIYVTSGGALDLTGGTFFQNATKNSGGAIYMNGSASAVMSGVTFDGNQAKLYGGAIYMNSATQATVTDCVFMNNSNPNNLGGAITVRGTAPVLTISGSSFSQNSAKDGGAISAFETTTLSVSDTTFTGNSATGVGGAIQSGRSGNTTDNVNLTLNGCAFTSNTGTNGGAVHLYGTGSLTATNTDFASNAGTGNGGAIYSYVDGATENVTLTDVTFDGNSATGNGGAIYHSAGSKASWTGVTFAGNASGGRGDATYVTNGGGKTTSINMISATFNQPSRPCIDIGNTSAYVTVHSSGITDVNNSPVDFSQIITGTTTNVTYEET